MYSIVGVLYLHYVHLLYTGFLKKILSIYFINIQIPFHINWHSSSAFFVISNERGQLQCWDRALNPLLLRLRNVTGSREGSAVLHLQQYLRHQPSIASLKWADLPQEDSKQRENAKIPRQKSMRSNRKKLRSRLLLHDNPAAKAAKVAAHHLFVCFERGPLLCLEFLTSCWPGHSSLGSFSLCSEFLVWQQFEAAVQHLLSLNWTKVNSFQVRFQQVTYSHFNRT